MRAARRRLEVRIGQHSRAGRKAINQDHHGYCIPEGSIGEAKGVALALADGVSSSTVSQVASKAAVDGFLADYLCTPEAWSVRTSVLSVMRALNAWLLNQTLHSPYRFERERGYVCTFCALVLKGRCAHLFHAGDSRIYRLRDGVVTCLTEDHRAEHPEHGAYLTRALGAQAALDLELGQEALLTGDVFVLATDGAYEFLDWAALSAALADDAQDLDGVARVALEQALAAGSTDNLSLQLVRVCALPDEEAWPHAGDDELPPAALPVEGERLDGYRILRTLHVSSRSHVFLARDEADGTLVALKLPSADLRDDPAYLRRFMLDEWIARRVRHPHVLRAAVQRPRSALYVAMAFVEGETLEQWMQDHPRPSLTQVRDLVEQIGRGLQALHRQEILHQDLRPANLMVDASGTVRIIDFGAVWVAGLADVAFEGPAFPGTPQYMAPEYFLGEPASPASDLFSLGVITYQLLSGQLPYGMALAQARTRTRQRRLHYRSVLDDSRDIPAWIDVTLRKAVALDPRRRYAEISEFLHDLRHPPHASQGSLQAPLIERHPVRFWQVLSLLLGLAVVVLLGLLVRG